MTVNIIAFGQLIELLGSSITLENVADTDAISNKLLKDFPALSGIKFRIAVDKKIVEGNTIVNDQAIIALLPPFSGG